jgi:hypothetical protein
MRRLTAAAAIAATLLLVACSPDAADFKSEAEKYIESREFSEDAGLLRYTEVECTEPESTDEDTAYTCTAVAEDGSRWRFDVVITGESDLQVMIPPSPLSSAPSDSSVPDTGPVSTAPAASPSAPATTTTAATTTTTTTT